MGGFARHAACVGGLAAVALLAVGCGSAASPSRQRNAAPASTPASAGATTGGLEAGATMALRNSSEPATPSDVAHETAVMKAALAELGVKGASVSAVGTRISVSAPAGTSVASLGSLFATHVLSFRQVDCLQSSTTCVDLPPGDSSATLATVRAGKSCSAAGKSADLGKACAEASYGALKCIDPADRAVGAQDAGDEYSVGCDASGDTGYLLFPGPPVPHAAPDDVLSGADVADIDTQPQVTSTGPAPPSASLWEIDLSFTPTGSTAFAALTAKTSQLYQPTETVPRNLLAIVVDGVVQSAPSNSQTLTGPISITGNDDGAAARAIAAAIRLSAVPATFTGVELPGP